MKHLNAFKLTLMLAFTLTVLLLLTAGCYSHHDHRDRGDDRELEWRHDNRHNYSYDNIHGYERPD